MYHIYWKPVMAMSSAIHIHSYDKLPWVPKEFNVENLGNNRFILYGDCTANDLFYSLASLRIELRYLQCCNYDTSNEQDALETEIDATTALIREEIKRILNV